MNTTAENQSGTAANSIRVRHEGREERVFVGEDVGLLVQGCIAEATAHEISKPETTRVAEDGAEFVALKGSLRGVIYGKGPVKRVHHEAFITVAGQEHSYVPHGTFQDLTSVEAAAHEPAVWKFTFEYSLKPCGCAGK